MANISAVLKQLRSERERTEQEVERLDAAITALAHVGRKRGRRIAPAGRRPRRRMSAAGRRRIAAAQRARWARVRRQKQARLNRKLSQKLEAKVA